MVDVEDDEALLDVEDEDVVMLEVNSLPAKDPAASERAPTPVTIEKVNVNLPDSERNLNSESESDNASGDRARQVKVDPTAQPCSTIRSTVPVAK